MEAVFIRWRKMDTDIEIDQHELQFLIQDYIVRFDIPMAHITTLMQKCNCFE